MRVFFDEDVPSKLAPFLAGHQIKTAVSMQWRGVKNGVLLGLVEDAGFEVFLTGDKHMPNQQRLERRSFAVLILSAITGLWSSLTS